MYMYVNMSTCAMYTYTCTCRRKHQTAPVLVHEELWQLSGETAS